MIQALVRQQEVLELVLMGNNLPLHLGQEIPHPLLQHKERMEDQPLFPLQMEQEVAEVVLQLQEQQEEVILAQVE